LNRRPPQSASLRHAKGFTLLEAIVAMVVFSLGAFALYGWLSTNMITLDRIRLRQEQEVAFASALDLVRRSNPMLAPAGQRDVGDMTVTWRSKPVEDPKPSVDQSGSNGIYMIGLYTVYVRVTRDGRPIGNFYVRQIGWKQTRKVEL
jgi:general secretion pathway protein I